MSTPSPSGDDGDPTTPNPNDEPSNTALALALATPTELAAANATHLGPTPDSVLSQFSIDDSTPANGTALPNLVGDVALPNIGETSSNSVDAGLSDDDVLSADDDDSEISSIDEPTVDADTHGFGLAEKTNQIMSAYKDYITEIQSEDLDGGYADDAMEDLEAAQGDTHGNGANGDVFGSGGSGPHAPFRYVTSPVSNISDTTPSMSNLHDVNLPTRPKSHTKMNDASSFEEFYGELSFHPRRGYWRAVLSNTKLQRVCMGFVGCVVVLGVIVGVATRGGNGGDQTEQEQLDAMYTDDQYIQARYQPKWYTRSTGYKGTAYVDAVNFCLDQSQQLCPYDAVCPNGPNSLPYGGIHMDTPYKVNGLDAILGKEQWSPVLSVDEHQLNEPGEQDEVWVKVGNDAPLCSKFYEIPGYEFYGMEGVEGGMTTEEITQFVMCCLPTAQPSQTGNEEASQSPQDVIGGVDGNNPRPGELTTEQLAALTVANTVEEAILKYQPKSFDRVQGWIGQTYLEAVHFCSSEIESHNDPDDEIDSALLPNKYKLCSYNAICPLGTNTQPVGGYKDPASNVDPNGDIMKDGRTTGMWVPVSDQGNEWVQIGKGHSSCVRYFNEYQATPVWGMSGEGNEGVTRHIICCLDLEFEEMVNGMSGGPVSLGGGVESKPIAVGVSEVTPASSVNYDPLYPLTTAKYKPQWFDREAGWSGRTYLQALAFCASVESMVICPFDAICPDAGEGDVYGGSIRTKSNDAADGVEAWAPIMDGLNDWVHVSGSNNLNCNKYSSLNNKGPNWGLTGSASDDDIDNYILPYVACCELNEEDSVGGQTVESVLVQSGNSEAVVVATSDEVPKPESPIAVDETPASTADDAPAEVSSFRDSPYLFVQEVYESQWFGRSDGWVGQTYDEAFDFCARTKRTDADGNEKARILCPYHAYCPIGPKSKPYLALHTSEKDTGTDEVYKMMWAPISDGVNEWIDIGTDEPCQAYTALYSEENILNPNYLDAYPEWGVTGEGNEEITRHVMCCDADAVESVLEMQEPASPDVTLVGIPAEEAASSSGAYVYVGKNYKPEWFDRSRGWTGQTYDAALSFCDSQRKGIDGNAKELMLCNYDAYCPRGPKSKPFGNYNEKDIHPDGKYSMWAPVSGQYNWWVDIGTNSPCELFEYLYPKEIKAETDDVQAHPEWGITGIGNERITQHVMCCDADMVKSALGSLNEEYSTADEIGQVKNILEAEEFMVETEPQLEKLNPMWFHRESSDWKGSTYADAVDYCERTKNMRLCPYTAYCPNGILNLPYGDVTYNDGPNGIGSWSPVADDPYGWISVSTEDVCVAWKSLNPEPPSWGEGGDGGEEVVRHVLCCRADHSEIANADQEIVQFDSDQMSNTHEDDWLIINQFEFQWFSRGDGWAGETYSESVDFCASPERKMLLCPIEAMCPALRNPARGWGPFDDGGPYGSYAPISNAFNAWVKIDGTDTCVLWRGTNEGQPSWGIRGQEDVTRHIMCCKPQALDGALGIAMPTGIEPSKPHAGGIVSVDEIVYDKYDPIWFTREDGWGGATYPEADLFCQSINSGTADDYQGMALCPFDAYCPSGSSLPPYGGAVEGTTQWAPTDEYNEWVRIDTDNVCARWSDSYQYPPKWGDPVKWGPMVGEEEVRMTSHIMCCIPTTSDAIVWDVGINDEMGPQSKPTSLATVAIPIIPILEATKEKYQSNWYDRSDGWIGNTYSSALEYCAALGSYIPCPYEAICPLGPGEKVVGGMRSATSYAPIVDIPNGWVSVGPQDTCTPYNAINSVPPAWGLSGIGSDEVTQNIMCCLEPGDGTLLHLQNESSGVEADFDISVERSAAEQSAMDDFHPVWYNKRHGYHGTSLEEAEQFCNNIGDKRLCPLEAYCPNGNPSQTDDKALFLDRSSFSGEQWAPISGELRNTNDSGWILVGSVSDDSTAVCSRYDTLANLPEKLWKGGDLPSRHKQNILCCANNKKSNEMPSLEEIVQEDFQPIWYSWQDGWNGSSWNDAIQFCSEQGGKDLCPYMAHCPNGDGESVIGGHGYDFDREGELWAPASEPDSWVMIGQKYQNSATTCMTSENLEGPLITDWGQEPGSKNTRKHIMCCRPDPDNL